MNTCYIIGAGDCEALPITPAPGDLIIAADGGLRHLQAAGLAPHVMLGDFDSLGYVPQGGEIVRLPCEKDVTDTHAAAQLALERGYRRIRIFGALGGARMDHTLANLQVLAMLAAQGADAAILDGGRRLHALHNGSLHLPAQAGGYISVFSHSDRSEGVSITGLKYSMQNAVLTNTETLGVSNEFCGSAAEIRVENGTLLILYSINCD